MGPCSKNALSFSAPYLSRLPADNLELRMKNVDDRILRVFSTRGAALAKRKVNKGNVESFYVYAGKTVHTYRRFSLPRDEGNLL